MREERARRMMRMRGREEKVCVCACKVNFPTIDP